MKKKLVAIKMIKDKKVNYLNLKCIIYKKRGE